MSRKNNICPVCSKKFHDCPPCDKEFFERIYCSLECFKNSPEYAEITEISARLKYTPFSEAVQKVLDWSEERQRFLQTLLEN